VPHQLTRRLQERIKKLFEPSELGAVDPARLAQEVALLADRSDVTRSWSGSRATSTRLGR